MKSVRNFLTFDPSVVEGISIIQANEKNSTTKAKKIFAVLSVVVQESVLRIVISVTRPMMRTPSSMR